jgi:NAD(P)-dependent dehydrogenase (short-subunit alcohol dehydrogenase family)
LSEFESKVGVIVGGGRGVGRASALALAALGAELLIVDVGGTVDGLGSDPAVGRAAADEVVASGGRARAIALDAALPEAAETIVRQAKEHFGRLDFGLYCAGFRHDRTLLRDTDAELDRVLATHLLAPIRFTRALAGELVAGRREGSVLLLTSAAAFAGTAGHSAHAAAAGGVVGFVRTAALELRRKGVRLNALIPTARTRLTEELPLFSSIRNDSLTSEHVAQVVCHVLSPATRDVNGEILGVAGGRIYGYRQSETSGAYLEGPPASLSAIAAAWRDVTKRS